ncbi:hypothetical protein CEXT_713141 [Caerostris extrusa]|uniref:Uncharacterized protein n=1 Tax=Caerostris extrusa TaxID=172846 RepID=A0AAV4VM74_CAEEX|nr:hypothetical protein CEXT_713141 [Caerostris extrusa]
MATSWEQRIETRPLLAAAMHGGRNVERTGETFELDFQGFFFFYLCGKEAATGQRKARLIKKVSMWQYEQKRLARI